MGNGKGGEIIENIQIENGKFKKAIAFNQSLNSWNVSNVTKMRSMFGEAESFNQPINAWNVSKVRNMSFMFHAASNFNQPLNNWNTSNVENMSFMFVHAISFNQPINDWDVSNVINMEGMFLGAILFNQPLNSWDVSNVIKMNGIFANSAFNQPINNWRLNPMIDREFVFSTTSSRISPEYLPSQQSPTTNNELIQTNNDSTTLMESSLQINPENETAIDYINMGDEVNVKQYLNEDEKNIVFYFNGKCYASNKDSLKYLTTDYESKGHNIKYECKTIGSMNPSNIIMDVPYFALKIIGLYGLASLSKINSIINDNNIRCIEITSQPIKQLVSTASFQATGNNPNYVGASHCQAGQEESVYDLLKIIYSLKGGKNKRSKKKNTIKNKKRKTKKKNVYKKQTNKRSKQ